MPIKDIVMFYGRDAGLQGRLAAALSLARRFEAHLVAVHGLGFPAMATAGMGGPVVAPEVIDAQYRALRQAAAEAERDFDAAMAREGRTGEWRLMDGDALDAMTVAARYADLAVVGQADPDAPTPYDRMPDHLLMAAGRPILVVPYIGAAEDFGRRILVAWNGSREATRALHDAMPLLTRAEEVLVTSINPPDGEPIPSVDLGPHLARHDVRTTVRQTTAPDVDVGAALLSAAADDGADLIVMGGYGHSRLRELALGGATRHLLGSMTVPVLMSH